MTLGDLINKTTDVAECTTYGIAANYLLASDNTFLYACGWPVFALFVVVFVMTLRRMFRT